MYQKKDTAKEQAPAMNVGANPFTLNVNASEFVPKMTEPSEEQKRADAEDGKATQAQGEEETKSESQPQRAVKKEGSFDFGGYQNPFKATIDIEKEKKKQLELDMAEESKKTYSIDFIMSMRESNTVKPPNMALLIMPHKKRQVVVKKEQANDQMTTEQQKF